MLNSLLIFLGAGLGGVFRFWISTLCYGLFGRGFPYGTLVVNASGCFLMGWLFFFIMERVGADSTIWRSLLLIGFLGGYTTFSSFSIETLVLYESGTYPAVVLNILLNVGLCITLTWLGALLARQA